MDVNVLLKQQGRDQPWNGLTLNNWKQMQIKQKLFQLAFNANNYHNGSRRAN